jgi:hypothetical protein
MLTKVSIHSAPRWCNSRSWAAEAAKIGAINVCARPMAFGVATDACAEWILTFVRMTNPV